MTKHIIMACAVILFFFLSLNPAFCAEEITITTYYPSPYGSYNKLTTNTLGIGDVDNDGGLDDDDAPDPSTNTGDLWLDGKIDMGRNSPYNVFIGYQAGASNGAGSYNTIIGYRAGYTNSDGANNVFLGRDAGYTNSQGSSNAFIGTMTGYTNSSGNFNTFLGTLAGYTNSTGGGNTFIGNYAGYTNSAGGNNTFVGLYAGYSSTGSNNIFIGTSAGYSETGSGKLYITNTNDPTPLIYGDFSTDAVTINGSLSATTCGGCLSDKKFKKDINTIESPIDKILKMRGVSFNWNEKYKGRGFPEGRHFGLIAQEVKEVLPEVVSYNSYKENTIVYTEIIPVLIEAIKEQQREIEILKKKIERKKL